MIKPTKPTNEKERIDKLKSYNILDTIPEEEYDALTFVASQICNTPISLVSLVDPDRQWFKSHHGLNATETPRDLAFCAHAINKPDEVLVIPDSRKDERFHDNPLATGAPNVIFYAGAPLNTSDGFSLGTLCVIDNKPREITEDQIKALKALADQVVSQLELRKRNMFLEASNEKMTHLNERLEAFAARLTHDLKAPIRGMKNLISFIIEDHKQNLDQDGIDLINKMDEKASYMNTVIDGMLEYSKNSSIENKIEKFNLEELVLEIERALNPPKSIVVNFNGPKQIESYKFGLSSIIQNLMSNSIKFSNKEVCQIDISVELKTNKTVISFEDNGPGIPLEKREKVFNIFENLGNNNIESTGIGLATVKSILDRMEGNISICDRCNNKNGVKFEIEI